MLRQQLETLVWEVLDRVTRGVPVEDGRVELKTDWPTEWSRAARRLAAHANAAVGENILWIIGVNETAHTVPGAGGEDAASWVQQVRARFDAGVMPELVGHVTVATEEGPTVVALEFTTDQAPYIVTKGDEERGFDRDVPWREGTRTRSAKRAELLRMLLPAVEIPTGAFYEVRVTAREGVTLPPGALPDSALAVPAVTAWAHAWLYLVPHGGTAVIPAYAMTGRVTFSLDGHSRVVGDLGPPSFVLGRIGPQAPPISYGVDIRQGSIYVSGPGRVEFTATADLPVDVAELLERCPFAMVEVDLPIVGTGRSTRLECLASRTEPDETQREKLLGTWTGPPTDSPPVP